MNSQQLQRQAHAFRNQEAMKSRERNVQRRGHGLDKLHEAVARDKLLKL